MKRRGYRNQLLTLVLLGQVKAVAKRGMLAGFIDFKKAYDRVDRGKLWGCLEKMGIRGRVTAFLKAVYSNVSCEVKVGEECSEHFEVSCSLRQGCILSPLLFSLYICELSGVQTERGRGWSEMWKSGNSSVIVCR